MDGGGQNGPFADILYGQRPTASCWLSYFYQYTHKKHTHKSCTQTKATMTAICKIERLTMIRRYSEAQKYVYVSKKNILLEKDGTRDCAA